MSELTARRSKKQRHQQLLALLAAEPFLTDEETAHRLAVSVATIRLDRLELGVPEMRERTRNLAEKAAQSVISMRGDEIIGELVGLELGRWGVSILQTRPDMGFAGNGILRGHHLFAQANSLAVAVIDAPEALTALARVRYLKPVTAGALVTAKAVVAAEQEQRIMVNVTSTVDHNPVMSGRFYVWKGSVGKAAATLQAVNTPEGRDLP